MTTSLPLPGLRPKPAAPAAPAVLVVGDPADERRGRALAERLGPARDAYWCTVPQLAAGAISSGWVDLVGVGAGGTAVIVHAAAHPADVRRLVVVGGGWPEDELPGSPAPERSLVVWGAADRRVRRRVGEKVVSALGRVVDPATVEMVTLPGVGHGVLDAAPYLVAEIVDEFLR